MKKISYEYYGIFEEDQDYPEEQDVDGHALWSFFCRYLIEKSTHWSPRGNCVGLDDPNVMFPTRYGKAQQVARDICAGCKVQRECLFYSLVAKEQYGIWGGCTERERSVLINLVQSKLGYSYSDNWTTESKNLIQTLSKRVVNLHEKLFAKKP